MVMDRIKAKQFEDFENRIRTYLLEHPEVIDKAIKDMFKDFVDIKDMTLGDKNEFRCN